MTQEAMKLAFVIEEFDKNDESLPLELLKPIAAALRSIADLESQEPLCPECKAEILYECVACSRNNYPPQRTWVGLTDEDMKDPRTHNFDFIHGARWAEAKLKEKNT
jgi:hypothetical protein